LEPLELGYEFKKDKWQAFLGAQDVTANLDPLKANFLVGAIESLEVTSWLSENDEEAAAALENPSLKFEITQNLVDEFGDEAGMETEVIVIGIDKTTGKVFGKKASEGLFFTLPEESISKLGIPLLDE
jgi:hypothetical protein